MTVIDLQQLMDAGVHLGHQTKKWHPKMKEFIYTQKGGYHIIDLAKSREKIMEAVEYLKEAVKKGKTIILVGTKRQSAPIIEEEAKRANLPFINYRWIGGLLTNFESISKTLERYKNYEEKLKGAAFEKLSTRDKFKCKKDYSRLGRLVEGIANLKARPDLLVVVDSGYEKSAVYEASVAGVPVVALLDTNSNPLDVEIPIPGNDDSVKSIKAVLGILVEAILEANKEKAKTGETTEEVKDQDQPSKIRNSNISRA